ncbi:saccharopine dehydrogenase NADP-binding domain-containing protein [Streptomyces sp. TRM 70361]|uniref:saccharopine dehydrogenase family protein n=1 Tax=Streptomyces sp. TRM 70361 TaxID=3116553 RepID=UPI002E7C10E0|nr:saccharopine dehydrogenase NADP-binding domain-containing protein [Streptomyces sp. TRM 70361]MEE1942877.1 saccharopine dehydrogenase NADP-binding domain-containing protein [Streptomyces sp. TRM 70361]
MPTAQPTPRRNDRGDDREHDVVLFGATGFTGRLTAEYLAAHAPGGCRWALAGRNREKLLRLREHLAGIDPACAELPLLHADVTDPASLRAVAAGTRVAATTVGPYLRHGEPLVATCAEAGTDYLDLAGEPEFVDLMYLRHHLRARETGARLVHSAGFDSVPHDLGVLYTVRQLPEGAPLRTEGFVRLRGDASGGTFDSLLTAFSRLRQTARTGQERRRAEPRPAGRRISTRADRPHRSRAAGMWAVPLPTIDPQVVGRSAAALERYGPDFRYSHYLAVRRLPVVAGLLAGAGALLAFAQLPPARRALSARLAPGTGPDAERRAGNWFKVRFYGEGGGQRVVTQVSGGDPGYGETAKMLAESALCLALDELPETSGQVTTAVAMGDALTGRLERAGIAFRVLSRDGEV